MTAHDYFLARIVDGPVTVWFDCAYPGVDYPLVSRPSSGRVALEFGKPGKHGQLEVRNFGIRELFTIDGMISRVRVPWGAIARIEQGKLSAEFLIVVPVVQVRREADVIAMRGKP